MKVLIACEFSGIVRDAFLSLGHDAMSCDIIPTESPGKHYIGDVLDILNNDWDLMIAHPPCRYLAASGARWWVGKLQEQEEALTFVRKLLGAPIPRICVENPVGRISTAIRKPDQYIQPWQFGTGETKKTGLWLVNLPLLSPTDVVSGRVDKCHKMSASPTRSTDRSRTYLGIAKAMATQWGMNA